MAGGQFRGSMKPRKWAPAEEALLRQRYPDTDTHELASLMKRTYRSLKSRAQQLGLRKSEQRFEWNEEALSYLRDHYADETNPVIAQRLGASVSCVADKAAELGIRK